MWPKISTFLPTYTNVYINVHFFEGTKFQNIEIVSSFYVLTLVNKGGNYSRKETIQGKILFKEIW